jgi:hypothetical protein
MSQVRLTTIDLDAERDRLKRENATLLAEKESLRLGKKLPEPVPTIDLVHVRTIMDDGSARIETMTKEVLREADFDSAHVRLDNRVDPGHTVLFRMREPDDDERINQHGASTLKSAKDFRIRSYPKAGKIVPIGRLHIILKRVLDVPYFWPTPQTICDVNHLEQRCAEIFPDNALNEDYYVVAGRGGRVYFAAPDVKLVLHAKMALA